MDIHIFKYQSYLLKWASGMTWGGGMGKKASLIKALDRDEERMTDCEGMKRDEMSLGSVENGLYFGREKKRMFLLQKA
jgi:hypothetical protein